MNTKKQLLIDTALDLFYQNGVNSVGINEILSVSGVAKKTLYRYFDSKEALIIATLMQRHEIFINWLHSCLNNSANNQEFVRSLFNALTKWFHNEVPELADFRGCYFINAAAECAEQSDEISRCCQQHKNRVRAALTVEMPVFDDSHFELICMLMEGAITCAYVQRDLSSADKCITWALSYTSSH